MPGPETGVAPAGGTFDVGTAGGRGNAEADPGPARSPAVPPKNARQLMHVAIRVEARMFMLFLSDEMTGTRVMLGVASAAEKNTEG
jgi:hypothetical protein